MAQLRNRRVVALLAPVALGLAACSANPDPDAARTQPVEDTRTQPSDAAQAQVETQDAPVDTPLTGDAAAQMLTQVAGIAGAMHAAAQACDPNVDVVQLIKARDEMRGEFAKMGGQIATFDREFDAAHESTTTQFKQATPAQQKQMCDELEQMAVQTPPQPAG